jgi:hypothetical protein
MYKVNFDFITSLSIEIFYSFYKVSRKKGILRNSASGLLSLVLMEILNWAHWCKLLGKFWIDDKYNIILIVK